VHRRRIPLVGAGGSTMPYEATQLGKMQRAIGALPEPTQSVYRMHLLDGLDYGEIGAALALSTAEVERHIAQAIVAIDRALRRPN